MASFRTEPTNFNRLVEAQPVARLAALLTQATLLRVDPNSGAFEPRLATAWTGTPDGLTWTFTLRPNVRFSDGTAFTAADVLFTFQALYDERVGSPLASEMRANGQPLQVRALDDHHVVLTFPVPFGPGLTILDSLPILPRHKLQAALDAGTFRAAWSAGVNPADMAGLGPFMLQEYVPAQHMRFVRNPNFWLTDAEGQALPYLDEIEVAIVPEQNAELLRLQAGESDLTTGGTRAEDLAMLRDAEAAGRIRLMNAGTAIDVSTFWFNLTPGAKAVAGKPWLTDESFRRAVSHAVNRQAIVDTVHLGAATPVYGPITPGHGQWFVPGMGETPFDLGRARTLLTSIGLEDRDGDGVLEDKANRPVRFSLLTQRGNTERERTSAVVQEQLRQVGIAVDVVALDGGGLVGRFTSGDYEAIYFGAQSNSADPANNLGFWLSNGGFHYWNPGQVTPATEWEARIDTLMQQQAATMDRAERIRLFTEVQQLVADHVPALWFAAANITVPVNARVGGVTAAAIQPPVLWNAERLYVTSERR
ncbi:MAG: ABC transporter substrate-binding protein [Acidobacteria bacterium]|nr:ABC transporter substrate-binding protein [Acidobacteriota bacterium]